MKDIDVSGQKSLSPSGTIVVKGRSVSHSGEIYAYGKSGGKVNVTSKEILKLDGSIFAQGKRENGGSVIFMSEKGIKSSHKSIVDVSGQNKGGVIQSLAKTTNTASGTFKANSQAGKGGKIDLTGSKIKISQAKIEAKGRKNVTNKLTCATFVQASQAKMPNRGG